MAEGAHLDGGLEYDVLRVGLFGTDENVGRLAVPVDVPVGTVWSAAQAVGVDGAGSVRAIQWTNDVLGYWPAALARGFKMTPNSSAGVLTTNEDMWVWGAVRRRRDFAGAAKVHTALVSAPVVAESGPFDVIVSWHDNPSPKAANEFAYTDLDPATGTYHVRILRGLDDPTRPGPYNTERFYKETVWHELGHVVLGLLCEMHGEGHVQGILEEVFGAGWNTGKWENRTVEAAAEAFKDHCYPERQYNNRTNKKLRPGKWERYCDLMFQEVIVPGKPLSRVMGDVATGLVERYSGPVDQFPVPAPVWDYQHTHKVPYDFPRRGGPWLASTHPSGRSWLWGNGGHASTILVGPTPALPAGHRNPPAPGTKVKFRVRWEDPLGELPSTAYSIDPSAIGVIPQGVVAIDMGGPEATMQNGQLVYGVEQGNRFSGGIEWLCGRSGVDTWDRVIIPTELAQVTWEKPDAFGDYRDRYEPVFFDCREAGQFELELVVPDHGGELGLSFAWLDPGFSIASDEILEPMPVRSYPTGLFWTVYPNPGDLLDYEQPQGVVVTEDPAIGNRRVEHIVTGRLEDAIPFINPNATEIDITVEPT